MTEDRDAAGGSAEPLLRTLDAPVSHVPQSPRPNVLGGADYSQTVSVATPTPEQATPDDGPRQSLPANAAQRERFLDGVELGRGGMGTVRRVFDTVLRRDLAMKVIHPEAELSRSAVSRFLEEAQITAQLEHPNIVPVHDLGSAFGDSGIFFTMKRVTGTTLTAAIQRLKGTHPSHEELIPLLRIILKVCDALEFAHGRGVVHCDLKPENIMIGSHGQAYVMDWGVAVLRSCGRAEDSSSISEWLRLPSAEARPTGSVVGTPAYMAPEQAKGLTHEIDERTDVYGLGAVLYEILTGSSPNHGKDPISVLSAATAGDLVEPASTDIWDELPPGLCRIATRALARQRESRYSSIAEMRREIEAFLDGGGWFAAQEFNPGEVIVAEGQQADSAYIIESGECEVFKLCAGTQMSVGRLGPGDVFGETAALSTGVRTATVLARERVRVRLVTRESLERELKRNQWLGAFVRALGARFREAEAKHSERPPAETPRRP